MLVKYRTTFISTYFLLTLHENLVYLSVDLNFYIDLLVTLVLFWIFTKLKFTNICNKKINTFIYYYFNHNMYKY